MINGIVRICMSGFLGLCCLGAIGCGDNVSPPSEVVDTSEMAFQSKAEIKMQLEAVASSGFAGSGIAGIRNGLEAMKSSDEKLATSLLADLDKLEAAENSGNQSQVKSIAASMAKKL